MPGGTRQVTAPGVDVIVGSEVPETVGAVVEEEDTYLVLSAEPEVREPASARLRVFHDAYSASPAEPGGVVVRDGAPIRLLAVVHDLSLEPSWREEWVAKALAAVFAEATRRRVRTLALPPLGRVRGLLSRERFVSLLGSALASAAPGSLERIWLMVPAEDVGPFRELFASALWD
jgi:hypothetical protein